jgi:hypothetical protein
MPPTDIVSAASSQSNLLYAPASLGLWTMSNEDADTAQEEVSRNSNSYYIEANTFHKGDAHHPRSS